MQDTPAAKLTYTAAVPGSTPLDHIHECYCEWGAHVLSVIQEGALRSPEPMSMCDYFACLTGHASYQADLHSSSTGANKPLTIFVSAIVQEMLTSICVIHERALRSPEPMTMCDYFACLTGHASCQADLHSSSDSADTAESPHECSAPGGLSILF